MRRLISLLFLLFFFCSAHYVKAQRKIKEMDPQRAEQSEEAKKYERTPFWDKVRFGGTLGGGLSSGGGGFFMVQPQAFYFINENFVAGLGITYLYWSTKYDQVNPSTGQYTTYSFHDNAYGMNLFLRHRIFGSFFGQAEYMPMNFTSYNRYGDTKRVWGQSLYLGAGLQQQFGRGGTYIFVLYDVLWKQDDLNDPNTYAKHFYASPWDIRVGFFF